MRRGTSSHPGRKRPAQHAQPPVPLMQWLLRRRTGGWFVAAVVLAGTLIAMDHAGWLLDHGGDRATYDGQAFTVRRVIDGDTLEIARRDRVNNRPTTRVRLWGVDAPEITDAPPGQPGHALALQARDRIAAACLGQPVILRLEPSQTRDRYHRLLAHVELIDGTSLNENLLIEGLARAEDRWPHSQLERYAMLQRQAQVDRLGLWQTLHTPPLEDE